MNLCLTLAQAPPQAWEAWFTLAVIAFLFAVLLRGLAPPDMVLWGGTILLTVVQVITPDEAISGFTSPSVLMIGALFVISAALRETGALTVIGGHMFGRASTQRGALARMIPSVTALSAFLNNTAVVAMAMTALNDWCRTHRVSPSRLLIPLSYLSIMGGMCTLIGTSTNLVVNGLMAGSGDASLHELGMFELAWIGVPTLVVGSAYLFLFGNRLLPDRKDLFETLGESARQYLVEVRVEPSCPLAGKRIDEAGLRRLPGLFLIEIQRDRRIISPVAPDEILLVGDQLTFSGVVGTIVEFERIPGFTPVADESDSASVAEKRQRRYCEAVISGTSPLIGKNIRGANFRALYNAAVVAVHRGRERLAGRIGDIRLRAGDTLLLQTGPHFAAANRNNPDFYLVSSIDEARPVRHDRTAIALGLVGLLIAMLVFGGRIGMSPVIAAFFVGGLMILTRCISAGDARRSVNLDVLLTIAAAFGLGKALNGSGAAHLIADGLTGLTNLIGVGGNATAALALIYGVTIVFNTLITSNATAALVFPIAITAAANLGVDPRPFAICVASAAAASFASPIAYQTNMMVYGPGGYKFSDFLRAGIPLHLLLWILAILLIPRVWPL